MVNNSYMYYVLLGHISFKLKKKCIFSYSLDRDLVK